MTLKNLHKYLDPNDRLLEQYFGAEDRFPEPVSEVSTSKYTAFFAREEDLLLAHTPLIKDEEE